MRLSRNRNCLDQIRHYVFIENARVWVAHASFFGKIEDFAFVADAGMNVIWYVRLTFP